MATAPVPHESAHRHDHPPGSPVVVVGGARAAGSDLARAAAARGASRVVLVDPTPGAVAPEPADGVETVVLDRDGLVALLRDVRPAALLHVPDRDGLGPDDWAVVALEAAEVGCTSVVTFETTDGEGHDPTTSDASLRAALANERTNADHLRAMTREQRAKLRRPLVRAALKVDRHLQRAIDEASLRRRRVQRRLARIGLLGLAAPVRTALPGRRNHLERQVRALPPAPPLRDRVSLVVVADGPVALDLLPLPDPPFEVIAVLRTKRARVTPDPDVTVTVPDTSTAAAAAAAGANRARGDLLCFLSGSTRAIDDHWLARLAHAVDGSTIAAVPLLVHPQRSPVQSTPHDLLVRAAGYDLVANEASVPEVRAHGAGDDPRPDDDPGPVDAGSSACFVVDRHAYIEAGGLAGNDDPDAAVVDLCSRLRAGGGRVAIVPSAVMVDHRPVASVRALTRPIDPSTPAWAAVVDRHGPALLQIARGDEVTEHLRIAITISAPSLRVAREWGDFHLAQALARSLRRLGHSVHLQALDTANAATGRSCDVHLVLRGLVPVERAPGQTHVLWIISHPESVDVRECDEADLVLVASERFADALRERATTPVEVMLQATDPRRFRPAQPDPDHSHAVAVVATTRGVFRPAVADALAMGLRPAIYGVGWRDFVDPQLVVADFMPNDQVAKVYSSVGVLLNDHWDTMRAWGFVSNRLFDALACATPVVTDHLDEIPRLFGDSVATYREPEELLAAVDAALDDPVAARARAGEGRATVLAEHTFDHRAAQLLDALARHGLGRILR